MVNNELYVESLSDYFLQLSLKAGYNETLPKAVEEIYVKQLIDKVHYQFELMCWSTTAGSSVKPAGLIYQLSGDTAVTKVSFAPNTGTTQAQWIQGLSGVRGSLPGAIQNEKDLVCFCSINQYYNFITANVVGNNYNIGEGLLGKNLNDGLTPIKVPGTAMWLVAVPGMPDANLVATLWSNLIYAFDMEDEVVKNITSWYSNDFRSFRTSIYHKLGFFYLFPDYCVLTR